MEISDFKLERILSMWQNQVKYNISASNVKSLYLNELITKQELDKIYNSIQIRYVQTNGTIPLRESISLMYPGTNINNILVTNGSAEANFLLIWSNIEHGDEVILMFPNYMQIWGLLYAFGAKIIPIYLKEEKNWHIDIEDLEKLISQKTKMIIVCNPNNPTGSILDIETMNKIVDLAGSSGAWILSDEIYRGAELDGIESPSFWGMYDKTLIVSGLSKAYALPGLRIGWIVGPEKMIAECWRRHDYTSITRGAINEHLACLALRPETKIKILKRNRDILNENIQIILDWFSKHPGLFHYIPPKAGGILFSRYNLNINSTELVMKLIHDKSVLIVPGDCFGMDHYLRFGYGADKKKLIPALDLIHELIEEIQSNPKD